MAKDVSPSSQGSDSGVSVERKTPAAGQRSLAAYRVSLAGKKTWRAVASTATILPVPSVRCFTNVPAASCLTVASFSVGDRSKRTEVVAKWTPLYPVWARLDRPPGPDRAPPGAAAPGPPRLPAAPGG